MRNFLLVLLCIPTLSYAEDSIPKHKNQKIIVILNIGVNMPEGEYGVPDVLNSSPGNTEVYGYSKSDLHTDITGVFIPANHVGLAVRYGMDVNPANKSNSMASPPLNNIINQYLVGIDILVNPKQSSFNLYFLGLMGSVTANIPNSDNGYYSDGPIGEESANQVPGFGVGVGLYVGMGLSGIINKHISFNFSLGYLNSIIYFQNGTTTSTFQPFIGPQNSNTTSISYSAMQMDMGIIQVNIGLSYIF